MKAIGIDLGGTKIEGCLVATCSGTVLARRRVPTVPAEGADGVLGRCAAVADDLRAGATGDVPVGLSICELVGRDQAVLSAATVDVRNIALARRIPGLTAVESDVRAAALAEASFGAARPLTGVRAHTAIYVSVGTGISSTLLFDGVPHVGAHGTAIVLGAPPVERVASGGAIARDCGVARATDAFADPVCAATIARAAQALGTALAVLVHAVDPHVIVVGGGLGLRDDYRAEATASMRASLDRDVDRTVPVEPAALGEAGAAIGAAIGAAMRAAPPGR